MKTPKEKKALEYLKIYNQLIKTIKREIKIEKLIKEFEKRQRSWSDYSESPTEDFVNKLKNILKQK